MSDFSKTTLIGEGPFGKVFVMIKFKGGRLSIQGVEGPVGNDSKGSSGQIIFSEWDIRSYADGWDADKERRLRDVWCKWHLNDMRTGSQAQEEFLARNPVSVEYPDTYYEVACLALAEAGLNPDPDTGYRYGSAWLSVDVPQEALDFLRGLPESRAPGNWND